MCMKKSIDAKRAIQTIAMKEGLPIEEVRKEMELAILAGLCSQNPDAQAQWKQVPCKGDIPTPEELITYLATHIDAKLNLF